MPIYEFHCAACGEFTVLKPLASRNDAQSCPACAARAERSVVSAPALARMPSLARHAAMTNERSQHEPHHFNARDRFGSNAPQTSSRKTAAKPAAKAFPHKRPWMISH